MEKIVNALVMRCLCMIQLAVQIHSVIQCSLYGIRQEIEKIDVILKENVAGEELGIILKLKELVMF